MKKTAAVFVLVFAGLALPAFAQIPTEPCGGDATPACVKVNGSDPAVLRFPVTAMLESFGVGAGRMAIRTTGASSWPAVSIDGNEPSQSATLWIFLNINGQWYATGAERLRPTQVNGDKPEGSPADLIGTGWLYAPDRWREMSGYNPRPGERIGVMVVAGSTRSDNNTPVKARTNILEILWPDSNGAHPATVVWNEAAPPPAPVPLPPVQIPPTAPPPVVTVPPSQPPPVAQAPIPADLLEQVRQLVKQQAEQLALERDTNGKVTEIHTEVRSFAQQFGSFAMWLGKWASGPTATAIITYLLTRPDTPAGATK